MASDKDEKAIENIFKAVTTRNAIIVIEENYQKYSIQNLILVIVQECLKKFDINENIIQIVSKEEIEDKDIEEFDIMITKNGNVIKKEYIEEMYIYQEDDYFDKTVKEEVEKLKFSGKKVEVLKGNLEECLNKINKKRNYGVSIYSTNRKKGYEFINLVKSDNAFFNGTLLNVRKNSDKEEIYFVSKNLICEYKIV